MCCRIRAAATRISRMRRCWLLFEGCGGPSQMARKVSRRDAEALTRRFEQQKPERWERQTKRLIVAVRGDRFGEDRAAVPEVGSAVHLAVAVDEFEVGAD